MSSDKNSNVKQMRLDKWLWCARFYKTRSLAATALKSGKVSINGVTVKPSRLIEVGESLIVERKPYHYDISITALAANRVSASAAAQLYLETEDSKSKRETLAARLKIDAQARVQSAGRPDKRARRRIIRFTRQSN